MKLFTALALIILAANLFAQDAGVVLTPLETSSVTVKSAEIAITPVAEKTCYQLLYKGRPVDWDKKASIPVFKTQEAGDFWFVTSGLSTRCDGYSWSQSVQWKVSTRYKLDVHESRVLPIGVLAREKINAAIPVPTVHNVKAYLGLNRLENPQWRWTAPKENIYGSLGPVWNVPLEKGNQSLKTEYEFEHYISSDGTTANFWISSSKWSVPVQKTTIEIQLPKEMPMIAFKPLGTKPACFGRHNVMYEFNGEWPEQTLTFSYPLDLETVKPFQTIQDWEAWKASMGDVPVTCYLKGQFKKKANKELKKVLESAPCINICAGKGAMRL